MAETNQTHLTLLGSFRLAVPSGSGHIAGARTQTMIAYLAMQPTGRESRERLANLFWGDRDDALARQSLRQALHVVQQSTGRGLLVADRGSVALDLSAVVVDARRFAEFASTDEIAAMIAASELYAAPFLQSLVVGSEEADAWIEQERARLATLAAGMFERLALHYDLEGAGAAAVSHALKLVDLDPLEERPQRLLIRLLLRHQGSAAALSQTQTLERMLRTELDAKPSPETVALIAELRDAPDTLLATLLTNDQVEDSGSAIEQQAAPSRIAPPGSRRPMLSLLVGMALIVLAVIAAIIVPKQPTAQSEQDAASAPQVNQPLALVPGDMPDRSALASLGLHSIVVLPFDPSGASSAEEQRLADRATGDLIEQLSRVPALRVISRATSRHYRGRQIDIVAVGRELGVAYVVDGAIRRDDGKLSLAVVLTDAATRLQLSSERFVIADGGSLVPEEIAVSLARKLHITVLRTEAIRRPAQSTDDPAVQDLVTRGWYAMQTLARDGEELSAKRLFKQALEREPRNPSALLGFAGADLLPIAMALRPMEPGELDRHEEALASILSVNERNSLALYYRGILRKLQGNLASALADFQHVIEINPSFAPAYGQVGNVLYHLGQYEGAIEQLHYAMRLSPRDPALQVWSLFAGQIEIERGRNKEAVIWLTKATTEGRTAFGHAALAAALAVDGDHKGAALHADRARTISPWVSQSALLKRMKAPGTQAQIPKHLVEGIRLAFVP